MTKNVLPLKEFHLKILMGEDKRQQNQTVAMKEYNFYGNYMAMFSVK